MPLYVTKADGARQQFDLQKVINTCLRMGASQETARKVAAAIERMSYDGLETRKILRMIFRELEKYQPTVRHQLDLKTALCLMNSKPDFERFAQILLNEQGYTVTSNQIVKGRCGEHEVDGIARKDGATYLVEAKHHFSPHTPTGLDASRIARAIIEDTQEAFELGLIQLKIDGAIIVCNTKLSEHARRYSECRGILQICWSYPPNGNLQTVIEEKKLYPITILRDIDAQMRDKLSSAGIVMLKQLVTESPERISAVTGINKELLKPIIEKGRKMFL